jgi:hypothetical protein
MSAPVPNVLINSKSDSLNVELDMPNFFSSGGLDTSSGAMTPPCPAPLPPLLPDLVVATDSTYPNMLSFSRSRSACLLPPALGEGCGCEALLMGFGELLARRNCL